MRRRDFLGGVGAWGALGVSRASGQAPPTVAYLTSRSPRQDDNRLAAFREGLNESGYTDGLNVAVEQHFIEGGSDEVRALITELVRRSVNLIYTNSTAAALIAKSITTTLPIVFTGGADPVQQKLVASLNKPSGNLTGATLFSHLLGTKRLELLREFIPGAKSYALMINPRNPSAAEEITNAQAAAATLQTRVVVVNVSSVEDFNSAFATIRQRQVQALLVVGDPLVTSHRHRIIELAARDSIPAIYPFREHVTDGGLISYGPSFAEASRHAGVYAGRILKGAKPADLPVLLPTKFELAINLKTAKALGLTIPPKLLFTADEVIE